MDGRSSNDVTQRYVFFSEEFERIMIRHEMKNLPDRIKSVFADHSKNSDAGRELYLYWTDVDKHLHALRVNFSISSQFPCRQTKYIHEHNIAEIIPGFKNINFRNAQEYFCIRVTELTDSRFEEHTILNLWFTLNGFIGELRHIQAGKSINPEEAMRIYDYFASFFRIENTYVCDDVILQNPQRGYQVPLRLMAALATGKTWFEQRMRGLKLVDLKQFSMTPTDSIQQNGAARLQDLGELQNLTLDKWYDMLDVHHKQILRAIYERNMPKKRNSGNAVFFRKSNTVVKENLFDDTTLMNLTAIVYKDALTQKSVTDDLWQLYQLLTGHVSLQYGTIPLDRRSEDYWVKSRVKKLLWSSCLWHHVGVSARPLDVIRHSFN